MKKYLFLAVFGLMFVPSLVSAVKVDTSELWKTLATLLQQENQLLKNEIIQLKEMNKHLSENSLCPSISPSLSKEDLYQADLAEINKIKADKISVINEAKRKECAYYGSTSSCSNNFERQIEIVLDQWEQDKANLSVKYNIN